MSEVVDINQYRIERPFRHMTDEQLQAEGVRLEQDGQRLLDQVLAIADQAAAVEAEKLRRGGFLDAPEGLPDGAA